MNYIQNEEKTLFDFGIESKRPRIAASNDEAKEPSPPSPRRKDPEPSTSTSTSTDPTVFPVTSPVPLSNDIAQYVDREHPPSPDELLNILDNTFVPAADFDWPYTSRMSRGKPSKRYLKREHFERCPSLTFSITQQGLYCRHCVLFGPSERSGHHGGQKLGKLVKTPLNNYNHLFGGEGAIDSHVKTTYHADALLKAEDFKRRVAEPSLQVSQSEIPYLHSQYCKINRPTHMSKAISLHLRIKLSFNFIYT